MNRSPVDDFVLALAGFLMFFGLGLAGLLVLFLSARYARSELAVVVWGVIAAVLMVLECLVLNALAGLASATSTSQHGYRILSVAVVVFALSQIAYFPLAMVRVQNRRRKRSTHTNQSCDSHQ